jgi:hypothetical protein
MGLRRILFAFGLLLVTWIAAEGRASACVTGAGCSGTKPTCDLLTFSCRACGSDVDCGAPFSGDICQTEGPQAGACINAADAGARNCSQDSECDTLGGYICSGVACVLGCHVTLFGDTCLVGAHCVIPIDVSISIGTCMPGGGGGGPDGGGIHDAGGGGDASTGCQTDADCGLSSGRVCVPGEHGNSCEPGCHDTAAGDTCPPSTMCSVTGGGLGVCREPGADGGPVGCTKDTDCAAPGVVCVDDQCVVGCHDVSGGDTCPGGTQCSVMNGGLGICVNPGSDAGTPPITCAKDMDCPSGLVCSGTQCVNGCRDTDAGDTCPGGAMCSVADGGVGICSGGGEGPPMPADGGSGDASDEGDGSLDGSNASPDATAPGDGGAGGEPTFEGGGCGCTSAHHEPAEGGGLVLLLAVTLLVRKRASK